MTKLTRSPWLLLLATLMLGATGWRSTPEGAIGSTLELCQLEYRFEVVWRALTQSVQEEGFDPVTLDMTGEPPTILTDYRVIKQRESLTSADRARLEVHKDGEDYRIVMYILEYQRHEGDRGWTYTGENKELAESLKRRFQENVRRQFER